MHCDEISISSATQAVFCFNDEPPVGPGFFEISTIAKTPDFEVSIAVVRYQRGRNDPWEVPRPLRFWIANVTLHRGRDAGRGLMTAVRVGTTLRRSCLLDIQDNASNEWEAVRKEDEIDAFHK
jgi:hypothetical protein